MKALNRKANSGIQKWMGKGKVIVLTGARQVGKTTLFKSMMDKQENCLWLNADEAAVRDRLQNMSLENLKNIIGKNKWVVIDEIQRIPNAGLLLKLLVDNMKGVQFIATGSSALDIAENIFEPLTGRHFLFHLHPLMLSEMYPTNSAFEIEQKLPFHLRFGCYPDVYNHPNEAAFMLSNLANQYLYKDVLVWKDIRKPQLLDKLLKLLAYQIGAEVSIAELANQLQVKSETVDSYIDLLEKSFVVFRLQAYSTNARKEITKMNKIYFWDVGIRNAVIDNFDDISMRNDVGALWENFMISERMKYMMWSDKKAKSFFWRNYNQSEVDYLEVDRKKIDAYELKWSTNRKHRVSQAFLNAYPDAFTHIITPQNFATFCGLD